ncbi:hypothetical protein PK35_09375 [Tamlana nanhaiensis]|uniref:PKD domain-containing protein n=1 Tax=Neotamlana nanhaiensis TaxID=1382798 RepID=A0A0D7W1Y9_9FLAO|nr:hypothetical protein PK35_09375 [Tamlana nanhaiensis]
MLLFTYSSLISQNETNLWYFGEKSGMGFVFDGETQVKYDGEMIAKDACVTISNRKGELLFYSNGINIWNKNHNIMINGVLVDPISTGGVLNPNISPDVLFNIIIVPLIKTKNIYYVFTTSSYFGLRYSIIDMNLNNGLGKVIEKNISLLEGDGVGKLSAVHNNDGESIWLMTTKKNINNEYTSFYAFNIIPDGRIESPVITDGLFYNGVQEGAMKFSPDGKKIACANYREQELSNHLAVFDFNSINGTVSNKRNLLTSLSFFEVVSVNGLEFSNDSNFLYATLIRQGMFNENTANFQPDSVRKNLLYQYDLSNANPLENAIVLHEETNNLSAGALQLANNGKIYRALSINLNEGTEYLGEIVKPNNYGVSSNYIHNSINLLPNKSRLGLPSFIQSYFRTRILGENGCVGIPLSFEVDTYSNIESISWDFDDGNTSNDILPDHVYTKEGMYNIVANIRINGRYIKVNKRVNISQVPNLKEDQQLIQCDDDADGISTFNLFNIRDNITKPELNEDLFFYESKRDRDLDINRIAEPDIYVNKRPNQVIFITAVNEKGCFDVCSFKLNTVKTNLGEISEVSACGFLEAGTDDLVGLFSLGFEKDFIRSKLNLANTDIIRYFPSFNDAQITENEIASRFYTSKASEIWVRVDKSDLSCSGIVPLTLIVNRLPIIDLEDTYVICEDSLVKISGNSINNRFEWIDSNDNIVSTDKDFYTSIPDTYTHIAYNLNNNGLECSNSKTFSVVKSEALIFDKIETIVEGGKNSVKVSIVGNEDYQYSINGISFVGTSNKHTFYNVPSGINTIYVKDSTPCNKITKKQIFILGYPKFFTPNNDGINDLWEVRGIDETQYRLIKINIFNRYGKFITALNSDRNFTWDGTINGEKLPSNDYWFTIELIKYDKSILKKNGHFSLIR